MKKLLSVLVLLLAVVFATAQTPKINYQAVVRDSHNRLVANTTIQVEVTVTYNGGTYSENLSGTTNANGLLSLEIGGGSNFNLIDWSTATIQTTAHLPGNETLQDVVNVTAVPLALHAEYADSVNLNVIANYLNSHNIPSGSGMNVQSDWNQTDTQADDYIKNKPSIKDTVSTYLNEHKYVTNANCDSLDFCALMGKVNTLVSTVNELNYALEDLSNLVGVLYGFIDSLGHVIDSLGGVIEELSGDTPPTTVEPVGSFNGKSTIDADGANNAQNVGYAGQYRSSDYEENSMAYYLQFYQDQINPATGVLRNRGRSVRLVKDAE